MDMANPLIASATSMADLGPFMEDVPFAWDAASRLKHAFMRAADELEEQLQPRNHDARHALKDWRGAYAR